MTEHVLEKTLQTDAKWTAGDTKTPRHIAWAALSFFFSKVEVLPLARFHNPYMHTAENIIPFSTFHFNTASPLKHYIYFPSNGISQLPALHSHLHLRLEHTGAAGGGEVSRSGVTLTFSQLLQWINLLVTGSPNKPTHTHTHTRAQTDLQENKTDPASARPHDLLPPGSRIH